MKDNINIYECENDGTETKKLNFQTIEETHKTMQGIFLVLYSLWILFHPCIRI